MTSTDDINLQDKQKSTEENLIEDEPATAETQLNSENMDEDIKKNQNYSPVMRNHYGLYF